MMRPRRGAAVNLCGIGAHRRGDGVQIHDESSGSNEDPKERTPTITSTPDSRRARARAATSGPRARATPLFALRPHINRTGFGGAIINVRKRKLKKSEKRSKIEKERKRKRV